VWLLLLPQGYLPVTDTRCVRTENLMGDFLLTATLDISIALLVVILVPS